MLTVPFFGTVVIDVVMAADEEVITATAEVVVTAEVNAGVAVAGVLATEAAVLDPTAGGVIVTPFSAQS